MLQLLPRPHEGRMDADSLIECVDIGECGGVRLPAGSGKMMTGKPKRYPLDRIRTSDLEMPLAVEPLQSPALPTELQGGRQAAECARLDGTAAGVAYT